MKKVNWKYQFNEGEKITDYFTYIDLDETRNYKGYLCFHNVKCKCGKVCSRKLTELIRRNPPGCRECIGDKRKETYTQLNLETYYMSVMRRYRTRAQREGKDFSLTEEEVIDLLTHSCHYCDLSFVNSIKRGNKTYQYNGIDRVDNKKGYVSDNVVSCCKICNKMKSSFPQDIFLNQIKLINEVQEKKNR